MKSYTDLEQSKVLAKILPIESADMHYVLIDTCEDKYDIGIGKYIGILPSYPAWSLSALLELLPNGSQLNKSSNGKYFCSGLLYDNPIDACVSEIELLTDTKNLKFNKNLFRNYMKGE